MKDYLLKLKTLNIPVQKKAGKDDFRRFGFGDFFQRHRRFPFYRPLSWMSQDE